jgi:hypothetical protein
MPRTSWSAAVVALALALLAVVGCYSGRTATESSGREARASESAKAAESDNTKFLADWPTPAGALIISGEQIGYLTPCGCTQGQKGGLIRRAILMGRLREQGWPLVPIDLGSLINDPTSHGGPVETQVRFTTALQALEMLNYEALGLSAQDLKVGVLEAVSRYANLGERPKVVAANVTPEKGLLPEGKFVPSLRASAGPVKVGITAVLDPEALDEVRKRDPDAALLASKAAEEVLPAVLADLEKDTHAQILMVQGPPEVARRLAKANPGFDVVVATSVYDDAPRDAEMLNDGKTMLVSVGKKGQSIGVVGLFQDPKQKFRYARITLTDRYDKVPGLTKLGEPMRKLIDEQFPGDLKGAEALQKYPRRKYVAFDTPSDATYVGAEACKDCHPRSYERWARSNHAQAYRGLTHPGRNREWDADCVSCHTTGFEYEGGYTTPEASAFLKGNQCENCHGPGSKHAAEPDNKAFLQAVARDVVDFEENHRCHQCHDGDNDPDFKFGRDWSKIDHTGLDTYDDPKVHRGAAPKKVARREP